MRRSGVVKLFLALSVATLVGAAIGATTSRIASLVQSSDGSHVYNVRRVRPPFGMERIRGIVPLGAPSGCYVVWSENRVDVFRCGFDQEDNFDSVRLWSQTFDSDVRDVVVVQDNASEEGANCFAVQFRDSHILYRADWFPR